MTQGISIGSQAVRGSLVDKADKGSAVTDKAAVSNTKVPQQDAATLSGAGSLLAAAATDDVRADKVAALRTAINNGTYNVPASAVADSLINNLLG